MWSYLPYLRLTKSPTNVKSWQETLHLFHTSCKIQCASSKSQSMRGFLRLCLATLVAMSHTLYLGSVNIGMSAVVVFYMLAGYVVTHLLHKHFPPSRLLWFYAERLLRIFPLYLVLLSTVALFLYSTKFNAPRFTATNIFANLTIVPLNYFMYFKVDVIRNYGILLPAWSLGAELQAYAVLPLIIRSLPIKWIVGLVSLCVFSTSALKIIDPDIWGYRLIPGIIYIFLTGSAICRSTKNTDSADAFDHTFPIICWVWLLILLVGLYVSHYLHPATAATILGFLIGMPIVQYASSSSIRLPFDAVMGQISYGVFLIHMPIAWIFEFFVGRSPVEMSDFIIIIIISIVVSAGYTLPIDHFIWPLRKSITKA